ncbi:hypothetical protein ACI7RC_03255 [Brevibacillus sp. B_LB10_24]|uniref:hypothetical protein n=1 Tax=Brevibacillus sp. B_LB10_24 TaxID=3380645 RepID=UPI0038B9EB51
MKKIIRIAPAVVLSGAMLAAAGLESIPVNAMATNAVMQNLENNSLFTMNGISAKDGMYVLDWLQDEVTGDGEPDTVVLIGHKDKPEDIFVKDIKLVLNDGKTKKFTTVSVGEANGGYEPSLTAVTLGESGERDLLVTMPTGGSGGVNTYGLISFKDGVGKPVVAQEQLNAGLKFEVKFIDQFKAKITELETKTETTVDISDGKEGYIESGIYDKDGKLKQEVTGFANGFSQLAPVWQPDGTFLLEGVQAIAGQYNADKIATASSTWKLEEGKLVPVSVDINKFDRDNIPSANYQKETAYDDKSIILDTRSADVNGDGVRDDVLLVGEREKDSIYATNLRVVVEDGKTKKRVEQSVGEDNGGYDPTLFIGRFDDGKAKDVLVSMATGGSGGTSIYSLLSFTDNKPAQLIAQDKLNAGLQYDVQFKDQYKVEVVNKVTKKQETIDLSKNKGEYIEMGIYDNSGKLLKATEGMVDGFGLLQPVDLAPNKDGIYELRGLQRISGAYHADGLATAVSTWSIKDGELKLLDESIVPLKR